MIGFVASTVSTKSLFSMTSVFRSFRSLHSLRSNYPHPHYQDPYSGRFFAACVYFTANASAVSPTFTKAVVAGYGKSPQTAAKMAAKIAVLQFHFPLDPVSKEAFIADDAHVDQRTMHTGGQKFLAKPG
jgi:hypothetical protein